MYKKLLAFSLTAALSACGESGSKQPPAPLACGNPAVVQNVRTNIQEIIKQEAQRFARNDTRQFIDADKIIAAATQLNVQLDGPAEENQNGRPICRANLSIQIPADILNTAQTNSPLVYGTNSNITRVVQERITGSPLTYDKGLFARPLHYTTAEADGQTTVNYEDNAITVTAQNIAGALLPYGVKSILMINGQPVRREDALSTAPQAFPDPPPADPQDILDNNAAANTFGGETTATDAPETLTPEPPRSETAFSAGELEQAKNNNQAADREINMVWNSIDQNIQKELINEQRSWIQSKNTHCRQAAAQAESSLQAEYLHLQCDTRMTRERSQYLRGYTIN
ncbi:MULTISPECIES: lysozyme inhibitor LprI family protein [unclassified Neisseria]|uniref:lysozyme inhibitor LprI family protein n=1 Tax=unclassified Neisseria TaxID=2623750 RepID=UPI0010716D7C|nr:MULTISPECIES: lysozyme inhibitor LprI family protein [unclassified Neisseria]MBF0804183.1 DUF1311 domain-containing protein [Neisseria sp. 19428wB4_WF04]TFU43083.1 DUF1311 domain-containing protein [Neisseria sp. WF04]